MKYGKIPYLDKPLSRIIYGSAQDRINAGEDASDVFESVLALGVTTFDTARQYGFAERGIGDWLEKRGHAEDVVILSKCGHHNVDTMEKRVNPKCMWDDLNESLSYLRIAPIDIYILHRDDEEQEVGPIVETFNEMRAKGKITAFGASNWRHQRIEAANEYAYAHSLVPFSISSPNFGLARQVADPWGGNCVTISGPENEAARAWYRESGMAVAAYSSIGRGLFSGKVKSADPEGAKTALDSFAQAGYLCPDNLERLARAEEIAKKHDATVAQIALAFLFASGMDAYAIVSTGNTERMAQNIRAVDIDLTEAEAAYLDLRRDTV